MRKQSSLLLKTKREESSSIPGRNLHATLQHRQAEVLQKGQLTSQREQGVHRNIFEAAPHSGQTKGFKDHIDVMVKPVMQATPNIIGFKLEKGWYSRCVIQNRTCIKFKFCNFLLMPVLFPPEISILSFTALPCTHWSYFLVRQTAVCNLSALHRTGVTLTCPAMQTWLFIGEQKNCGSYVVELSGSLTLEKTELSLSVISISCISTRISKSFCKTSLTTTALK